MESSLSFEIWLRVQQMMKGSDIGIQEKKAKFYNQKEVDDQRAERLAKTHDPLALMANSKNPFNYQVFHQDQPSPSTYMQQPQPNNNYNPQPSINQNYMQQPMPNPKTLQIPQPAMNMALVLMAKAFKLNYSTTTREFHQTLVIGRLHTGIEHGIMRSTECRNQVVQEAVQISVIIMLVTHNGHIVIPGSTNQKSKMEWNVCSHARAEASIDHRDSDYNAPSMNSDESSKVHNYDNCYDNEIFNMFTQEEQYTELLEPIPEPHQVQQNDSNVISDISCVEQEWGTADQHPATVKETRAYFESLYNNLALEVEKLSTEKSTVSSLLEEKKKLKSDFKIREDELLDKQIHLENKIKELDNILVKTGQSIQTMHMLSPKPDSFYHTEQKMALGY
ncbi:hypothetical protein Tco_1195289 [Tanacetum coccineum]